MRPPRGSPQELGGMSAKLPQRDHDLGAALAAEQGLPPPPIAPAGQSRLVPVA
jgi:hypothetical protein